MFVSINCGSPNVCFLKKETKLLYIEQSDDYKHKLFHLNKQSKKIKKAKEKMARSTNGVGIFGLLLIFMLIWGGNLHYNLNVTKVSIVVFVFSYVFIVVFVQTISQSFAD